MEVGRESKDFLAFGTRVERRFVCTKSETEYGSILSRFLTNFATLGPKDKPEGWPLEWHYIPRKLKC